MNQICYKSEYSINAWQKITNILREHCSKWEYSINECDTITYLLSESRWLQVRIQHQSHIIPWHDQRWQSEQSIWAAKDTTHHALVAGSWEQYDPKCYDCFIFYRGGVSACYVHQRSLSLHSVAVFTVAVTISSAPVVVTDWDLWIFNLRLPTVWFNLHYIRPWWQYGCHPFYDVFTPFSVIFGMYFLVTKLNTLYTVLFSLNFHPPRHVSGDFHSNI